MERSIDKLNSENQAKKLVYQDGELILEFVLPNFKDVPAICESMKASRNDLARFFPFAHYDGSFTYDSQDTRVKQCLADFYSGKHSEYWVFRGPDRTFVSCCSMYIEEVATCDSFELGYWVSTPETGKGYGTLINKILTVYMLAHIKVDRLAAPVNSGNKTSCHIYEKLGFKREGVMRGVDAMEVPEDSGYTYEATGDSVMYSLLADEVNKLPWFNEIANQIKVFTLSGTFHSVQE